MGSRTRAAHMTDDADETVGVKYKMESHTKLY